jgi:hypothetical protein
MTILLILVGATLGGVGIWALMRGSRRAKPSASNNWRNEDYMSREADGTFSEGSTYSKAPSRDSTGLGL